MSQVDFDSRAIVVAQGSSRTDLAEKPNVEILRRDRESHRHKQIWTKDAHGGPYRKATNSHGLDPLTHNMDGSIKKVELGYEKAEIGPTTNFVGNHMTQGAIDLVQAELGQTHLLKNSLQKKIDIVQKVEASSDSSTTGPPALPISDSTSDVVQQAEEFSQLKADQTVVDLLPLVPSEGPPDLNTIRKYIRRNRN